MRIEIIDLKDDPFDFYDEWSGDDLLDDEWQSEEFESFLDYSKIGSGKITNKKVKVNTSKYLKNVRRQDR